MRAVRRLRGKPPATAAGFLRLVWLQRTPQGLESSRPFALRQQRRGGLHQPHPAEELTLSDVMDNRLLVVRLEEVLGPGFRHGRAEPPQRLPESDPRRPLEAGHFTSVGAHPRGIEIRRPLAQGTFRCERHDGKLSGLAVNLGARIAAAAGTGEVLVSRTVRDLVAGTGLTFEARGERQLKGIPGTWQLYAANSDAST